MGGVRPCLPGRNDIVNQNTLALISLHFAYIQPPVAMLLVFTCLLNSSHHPACNASTDCSAEVQLFQEQKDKAVEVGTITIKTLCCDEFFFADVQLHDI